MINIEYKWYAVYTKPRNEKKVAEELKMRGIVHYLPLVKTLRQWSDRKKKVEVPLFNSYLFVHVSNKEYNNVLSINAVMKYVCIDRKPVSVPENQIEAIKRTLQNEVEFEISTDSFKKGQMVEITDGAMQGITGEVITISGKQQLLIRIENIGYSLVVNINSSAAKILN